RIPLQAGPGHPVFDFVTGLMREQRASVKLSGAYLYSKRGAPDYEDVAPLARTLVQTAPSQVVWGSDWPHTQHESMTSYADSWRRFESLVSDEADRRCITGETAAQLFQFA
ncbi:UNVERIFIED_CONTAM: amidohydrolase family protein, partial [Streptococcus suis]